MEKSYTWRATSRVLFNVKVADELWYSVLANGEKQRHLLNIGWAERKDAPGVKLWSLTILWLSLHVGVASNNKS